MVCSGRLIFLTIVIMGTVEVGKGSEQIPERTEVQGRQTTPDSYWYNDVYYWWPWFSDLATVVMIKLKIAIGMAAIYAFGDGYYWSKAKTEQPEVSSWNTESWHHFKHHPLSFLKGWGRRKRDLMEDDESGTPLDRYKFAEFLFDAFGIYDEDCRRRTVCELDFEISSNSKVENRIKQYKFDLFRKYRGKPPKSKGDCERMYGSCKIMLENDYSHLNSIDDEKEIKETTYRQPRELL
ncbi:uncharacterized protein LOC131434384 [Malaya genurostris]|uniref:uncharacterized protein LOC131434384 n=1 Tax=Malaya genurostris TaxID=325434 RepID=UPI0026F399C3|nr:uncharacterized protein LOC131434384 [Malaya genurostris]